MKIGVIGDLHGIYPDTSNWPKLDLLLIGGDNFTDYRENLHLVIQRQQDELLTKFNPWLEQIPLEQDRKIVIGGNHCHVLEHYGLNSQELLPGATYLQNNDHRIDDLHIWGTPYSYYPPNYPGAWSFGSSEEGLKALYESIPKDVDIVMSHTPAYGAFDLGWGGSRLGMFNFGSKALRTFLEQNPFPLPNLKLFSCHHVHEHGTNKMKWTWWDAKEERRRRFWYVNGSADPMYNHKQELTVVEI